MVYGALSSGHYGGLQAFGGVDTKSKKNFYTLLGGTIGWLGRKYVAVGAADMARLACEAQSSSPAN